MFRVVDEKIIPYFHMGIVATINAASRVFGQVREFDTIRWYL